ncbi:uncharacterized protein LOC103317193 isoform X2 [Nasonia vitripennis]|uniref:Uncharacterized protein n=1 Tax=Nasonia vitripennis TaxID=7425 RepID=A0A7M7Q004_NASVI|nr:uncharacterized protein LOC103317193 isoform X2 [Nasonia vitripennis]
MSPFRSDCFTIVLPKDTDQSNRNRREIHLVKITKKNKSKKKQSTNSKKDSSFDKNSCKNSGSNTNVPATPLLELTNIPQSAYSHLETEIVENDSPASNRSDKNKENKLDGRLIDYSNTESEDLNVLSKDTKDSNPNNRKVPREQKKSTKKPDTDMLADSPLETEIVENESPTSNRSDKNKENKLDGRLIDYSNTESEVLNVLSKNTKDSNPKNKKASRVQKNKSKQLITAQNVTIEEENI